MRTMRNITGSSMMDCLNPPFRIVNFDDEGAMRLTATQIRRAWRETPHNQITDDEQDATAVAAAMTSCVQASANKSDEEWLSMATLNPDIATVHTSTRDLVYRYFNHVFADTYRFLLDTVMYIDAFKPPCDKALPVYFPADRTQPLETTYERDVFMIPAFLREGVRLRIESVDPGQGGAFDEKNPFDIWWIQGGKPVKLFVEGELQGGAGELAAVLVLGLLTEPVVSEEVEGDAESDEGEE